MQNTIVSEISKTWDLSEEYERALVSTMFEEVIASNAARGYSLHSWKFNQISLSPNTLLETIIAVFKR